MMNKKLDTNNVKKSKFQKPVLVLLTRNEPEKTAVAGCCKNNMSLADGGCNKPMRG